MFSWTTWSLASASSSLTVTVTFLVTGSLFAAIQAKLGPEAVDLVQVVDRGWVDLDGRPLLCPLLELEVLHLLTEGFGPLVLVGLVLAGSS